MRVSNVKTKQLMLYTLNVIEATPIDHRASHIEQLFVHARSLSGVNHAKFEDLVGGQLACGNVRVVRKLVTRVIPDKGKFTTPWRILFLPVGIVWWFVLLPFRTVAAILRGL